MIADTPIVLRVSCPECGANIGKRCKEFNFNSFAHLKRVEAAQPHFTVEAEALKTRLADRVKPR
jgi:hypothetical protein